MEEQILFNQVKSFIEKEIHGLKTENDKLKKENQEIKKTFSKLCQLCKVDLGYPSQNSPNGKTQTTDYNLIDLDLPSGTLWMDRNVGAKSPTDSGLYFAWGETTGYKADEVGKAKQFNMGDYKYANDIYYKITKHCYGSDYGLDDHTDSFVALQIIDDAAYQFTNGKCCMPTKEQLQELIDNTTYKWSTIGGVKGGLFTSKTNGNSIFIPANGCCYDGSVYGVSKGCHLLSSSLDKYDPYNAWYLGFGYEEAVCCRCERYFGFSVRGVVWPIG